MLFVCDPNTEKECYPLKVFHNCITSNIRDPISKNGFHFTFGTTKTKLPCGVILRVCPVVISFLLRLNKIQNEAGAESFKCYMCSPERRTRSFVGGDGFTAPLLFNACLTPSVSTWRALPAWPLPFHPFLISNSLSSSTSICPVWMSYLGLRPLCFGAEGTGVLLLACLWFLSWWTCPLMWTAGVGGGAVVGEGS